MMGHILHDWNLDEKKTPASEKRTRPLLREERSSYTKALLMMTVHKMLLVC